MKKLYLSLFFSLIVLMTSPVKAFASQGIFELKNQVGEAAVCYATSGIMEDQRYNILTLCQNILYPGGTQVYHYVAWMNPSAGGNAVRLGEIGLGKKLFKANVAFSSMFVTKELQSNPRTPTGTVVMRGTLEEIKFLKDNEATTVNNNVSKNDNELTEVSPTPSATTAPAGNNNIFRIVAAGGIVAFLGLFGVILIIFVISRR